MSDGLKWQCEVERSGISGRTTNGLSVTLCLQGGGDVGRLMEEGLAEAADLVRAEVRPALERSGPFQQLALQRRQVDAAREELAKIARERGDLESQRRTALETGQDVGAVEGRLADLGNRQRLAEDRLRILQPLVTNAYDEAARWVRGTVRMSSAGAPLRARKAELLRQLAATPGLLDELAKIDFRLNALGSPPQNQQAVLGLLGPDPRAPAAAPAKAPGRPVVDARGVQHTH